MPATPRTRLDIKEVGEVTVVYFTDRKILDEDSVQAIGEQLLGLADEGGRRNFLLNFRNVDFLSSAALSKFLRLYKRLQQVGGRLVLCEISEEILEVFRITALDQLFTICDIEREGLEKF